MLVYSIVEVFAAPIYVLTIECVQNQLLCRRKVPVEKHQLCLNEIPIICYHSVTRDNS